MDQSGDVLQQMMLICRHLRDSRALRTFPYTTIILLLPPEVLPFAIGTCIDPLHVNTLPRQVMRDFPHASVILP